MVPRQDSPIDPVRDYLRAIGRIALLEPEEEVSLARKVKEAVLLEERLEKLQARLQRRPTDDEIVDELELSAADAQRTISRGRVAKNKMVAANLRLVVSIAKKYLDRGLEFLDLIQEGSLGLERAAEKFDPLKGYRFSTYAYWWIRQAITRAIAEQSRTVRLPIHITEKLNKLKKVERELTSRLGRSPTQRELLAASGLTSDEYEKVRSAQRVRPMSLERLVGTSEDTELGDLIPAHSGDPLTSLELNSLMENLDERTRFVLTESFGLEGPKQSLANLGRTLGLSRERVRQIQSAGIDELRKAMGLTVPVQ